MQKPQGQSRRIVRPELKRRRPPLACVQCYSRKIKCDRESPACGGCVRIGKGHECIYRNAPSDDHRPVQTWPRPRPRPSAKMLTDEGALTTRHAAYLAPSAVEGGMAHLKGSEMSTKFYGFSYPLNLYQQFPELRSYIAQIKCQNPTINELRDEIYGIANSLRPRYQQHSSQEGIVERFEALIPTRNTADMLVQTYIDRFEVIHRIIHIPTFMADYCGYWDKTCLVSADFFAQLLLMMATGSSLHPEVAFNGVQLNPSRRFCLRWIDAVESWLVPSTFDPASESSYTLTTHTLLVVAKRANSVHESALWSSTGSLVRRAMAAGYHREVGSAMHISLFNREMRRRLWSTVAELDLQASIERGMPPSLRTSDFNVHAPLHLEDEALRDSIDGMPPAPQLLDTWSTCSCQVLLSRTFVARLEICSLINGSQDRDVSDEVLQLSDTLIRALQEIPAWRDTGRSPRDQQTVTYVRSAVAVILDQYLIVLHVPMAIQSPPTWKTHVSRLARLDAATGILMHHRRLVDDGILSECAYQHGLVLGALNLCHELYLSWTNSSGMSHMSTLTSPEIAQAHLVVVERALQLLHGRVSTTLEGLNEFYVLAMVIGLIKSKICPQLTTTAEHVAAQQVIQLSEEVRSAIPTLSADDAEDASAFMCTQPDQSNHGFAPASPSAQVDYNFSMFPDDLGFLHGDFLLDEIQVS
ncbi:hypothetical protein PV08_00117 [Exophiala spinifera]|uniref:Zn(2)-C6 fungal-type domain-containing protein n=1 Tax=Exophiala spinifera TaxID=91928 RepID=A0A0D2BLV9_9EURO|nr:uncharacterized protein PV08_00117 [Exophiala spinifera]KIW19545.1 hypothetical protein PV08_00117 [Exophiala spinifera]